jgi:hypothetical protein
VSGALEVPVSLEGRESDGVGVTLVAHGGHEDKGYVIFVLKTDDRSRVTAELCRFGKEGIPQGLKPRFRRPQRDPRLKPWAT